MPKVFKVEKAFVSTQEDKKTPQLIDTQGGPMHKYMVQFENQSIPGWIGILKKPENSVNVGDEMYGVLEENNWGKPQFTRMQLPQDGSVTLNQGAVKDKPKTVAQAPTSNSNGVSLETVNQKLDRITAMLDNFLNSQKGTAPAASNGSFEDFDDGPVDLSSIQY